MRKIKTIIDRLSLPVKCSLAYMFSSILVSGLSFLTMPIFTRILSTEEMGIVTTFSSWQTILSAIVTLSLGSASYSVAMVEFKEERDKYDSAVLTLSCLSCVFFLLVYLCFQHAWNALLGLNSNLIIIMFASFFVTPAMTFWMSRQRYEFKYRPLLIVSISSAIISTASSVAFVLIERNNGSIDLGTVKILGKMIPELLISACLYMLIMHNGRCFVSRKYWVFSLKLSIPLIVHSLSKHILDTSDRIMIDHFWGKSEVGIYGVLYTISTLSIIVWSAINASLIPVMFDKLHNNQGKDINNIIKPLILVYGILSCFLSLLSPEIVHIIAPEEYYSAIYIMPPIASGIFLTSLYTIFGNYLTFYKKTNLIMISTFFAALINVVLNYIFIPLYGSIAASYTTLIAYVFLAIFQFFSAKHICGKDFLDSRFLILGSIFTLCWCLICNLMYKVTIIRYCVFIIILFLIVIKRRMILSAIMPIFRVRTDK